MHITERPYQQCSRCVMDTTANDIYFDESGICNYCTEFLQRSSHIIFQDSEKRMEQLNRLITKIKSTARGKPYDCIIGVSGGVDSSWTLVQAVSLGLRPLAVHMDNGWNTELAQNNIANLVGSLGVDLYTHVIDWEEYRALMQAFFDADVIDVELLYDNAMLAVNYQQAAKFGVNYILAGTNLATEGLSIPKEWNWFKLDRRNIVALARRFSQTKLKTFPALGVLGYLGHQYIKKIRWLSFLDYLSYNKYDAMNILEEKFNYKPYPYKHYESVFTRFYQGYILPKKFGVDKRIVHLSTLVISGQMSRDDALAALHGIAYPSEQALKDDIQYFTKKMGWSRRQLEEYLSRPEIPHHAYPSEKWLMTVFKKLTRLTPRYAKNLIKGGV